MAKSYAILPCNGLDKCAGCIAREVAIAVQEKTDSKILCPVFYRVAEKKYNQLATEMPVLVIDGCATRCASKIASEKGLKIAEKINVSEIAKDHHIELGLSLQLGKTELDLVKQICDNILTKETTADVTHETVDFPNELDFEIYKKNKFIFHLPKNKGFYFNENDVWAYVVGNKARIGVTDYGQKNLSDIMFFTPPVVGNEVSQFEELGSLESGKAVFEIVSPVSGTIIAVNEKIVNAPEIVNQEPYQGGWIVEMELSDFESDKELLHEFDGYYSIMKEKVDAYHV